MSGNSIPTRENVIAVLASEGLALTAEDDKETGCRLQFCGRHSDYVVRIGEEYLGAYSQAKGPRPGEWWIRGNDLADGPRTIGTLDRIVADVRSWEAA